MYFDFTFTLALLHTHKDTRNVGSLGRSRGYAYGSVFAGSSSLLLSLSYCAPTDPNLPGQNFAVSRGRAHIVPQSSKTTTSRNLFTVLSGSEDWRG